jgi:reactive intermediate/imine deaminase
MKLIVLIAICVIYSEAKREEIYTPDAPAPIGTYSQAIRDNNTVYLAGQISINATTGKTIVDTIEHETEQIFYNIRAVAEAAGGTLDNIDKLTIFITDFKDFPTINSVMAKHFNKPYPARSAVGVASLPKGVHVEVEGIMILDK